MTEKKTRFNQFWLKDPKFKQWLEEDSKDPYSANCKVCGTKVGLSNMGVQALKSHADGKGHKRKLSLKLGGATLDEFFTPAKCAKFGDGKNASAVGTSEKDTSGNIARPEQQETPKVQGPEPPCTPRSSTSTVSTYVRSDDVLQSEIVWTLKVVASHYSQNSSQDTDKLFQRMFPDSVIAQKFHCGKTKCGYMVRFGLAPYFLEQIMTKIRASDPYYTISFDESFCTELQQEQMDLHIRFWDNERKKIICRYLGSQFLGHTRASDLCTKFQEAISTLNSGKLLQIGMDGPTTNLKFQKVFEESRKKQTDADIPDILNIGTCGLHTVHNAFKVGVQASGWKIDSILKAMHNLLHNSPARTEDYLKSGGSKDKMPKRFCPTRWTEDEDVAQRAKEIWPDVVKYLKQLLSGPESKTPKIQCVETLKTHMNDPLIPTKLEFFVTVANKLKPFLEDYQSEAPMLVFMGEDLEKLLRRLMKKFVKKDVLDAADTPAKLAGIDMSNSENFKPAKKTDVGTATDNLLSQAKASDLQRFEFYNGARNFLKAVVEKMLEKSPLKFDLVRYLSSLNPVYMSTNVAKATYRFGKLAGVLHAKKWLTGTEADCAREEYELFSANISEYYKEEFKNYKHQDTRVDEFLYKYLGENQAYRHLWQVTRMVLTMCHGQADVERGFSFNKDIVSHGMLDDTISAYRTVHDGLKDSGLSPHDFPVSKDLLTHCRHAYNRYKMHLDEKKKQENLTTKETESEMKWKKELSEMKKNKNLLESEIDMLDKKVESLYKDAENKRKWHMLTEANALHQKSKEKSQDLKKLDNEIAQLNEKLRKP